MRLQGVTQARAGGLGPRHHRVPSVAACSMPSRCRPTYRATHSALVVSLPSRSHQSKKRGCILKALDQLDALPEAAQTLPSSLLGPVVLVGLIGLAAYRLYVYSQLEYITAAMLSRHVPREAPGARVIQAGGGTKELFYYPKNILQVTIVGEKLNKSLLEQAGIQASVPTIAKVQAASKLGFSPPASVDAVVSCGAVGELGPAAAASFLAVSSDSYIQFTKEAARVLKPGRPFIFIEKDKDTLFSVLESAQAEWDGVEYDMALSGPDAHVVGVAFKSIKKPESESSSAAIGARSRFKNRPKDESKGFL